MVYKVRSSMEPGQLVGRLLVGKQLPVNECGSINWFRIAGDRLLGIDPTDQRDTRPSVASSVLSHTEVDACTDRHLAAGSGTA